MILFPPCKINIGLFVTEKRTDGYHNIESIFYPIPWTDILEVVPSATEAQLFQHGAPATISSEDNIVWTAYELMRSKFSIGAAEWHLFKNLPSGAGLGGGSADGAYAIRAINDLFELQLTSKEMEDLAASLGSDCPFFIEAKPKFVSGRGEKMAPLNLDLKGMHIQIVHPALHVNTAEAYRMIIPGPAPFDLRKIESTPLHHWKESVVNDFEKPVFNKFPELQEIKNTLYNSGARYAAMSGSGSSIYGLFDHAPTNHQWPSAYSVFTGVL
jgi:4-diphosphocytidyl-2-C-methyl-D-erythritol kinase